MVEEIFLFSLYFSRKKWQLPFNTAKCKCLNIGNANPLKKYKIVGENLEQRCHEKDLAVIVDQNLSFLSTSSSSNKESKF